MPAAHIVSTGTALPGDVIDNEVMAGKLGISAEWIEMFIGTRKRHFAIDLETGKPTHTLADLGAQAGAQALARAGLEPEELDFVILATATPDTLMPATVNLIASRLCLNHVSTYQLQSGCAGAVQALDLARRLLDDQHRLGLVIGGDAGVKHFVADREMQGLPTAELVNYVLFGDGAGAIVVTSEAVPGAIVLRQVLNRFTGLGRAPGQIVRWFGAGDLARTESEPDPPFEEDYKAIEERVPPLAREALDEILSSTGWDRESTSYLLPPQLSGRMTSRITSDLALGQAAEISCVAETGNTGNATPFFQLDLLYDRIRPGERAVAIAIESSKWIKGAFTVEGM
ncbi:3-oxoacyl-ACP synthase III family protein [Amycolatopsis sp. EV170708-02-1]|uniref:3-oxoacyl-ACP synthase III family protein n=1 Tax=Amycolatopsis sp. EV170708-02-1 TaxID=2919322 RepID=UPI001F0BBCB7|nr:3-oxoacyl-ACP synthase III family protein [Amycolatopsis sp. EV170708-02-1]UMP06808.1 3-oxoacyl-ACP synthase III family protein [Amycolatopsis sp. EV170708-02-1]